MGTYIERLKNYEQEMNFEKKGLTFTVSGLSGSGKTALAKAIAQEFDLKMVQAGDIFRELAKEKNISIEDMSTQTKEAEDIEADVRTLELAKKGGVVLVGRLAGWAAGGNADVKIWVHTDLDVRAKRVANRDHKTLEEAKKDLIERDSKDRERYKNVYNIDLQDTSIYDMLINNTNLSWNQFTQGSIKQLKNYISDKNES